MCLNKCKFFFIFLVFTCLLSGCTPEIVDSYGRPINMSSYRGKWVVINYWASWCGLCIQQIPALNKLATYYRADVVVLGVNPDNLPNSVLQSLAKDYQVNYAFLSKFPIEKWDGKQPTTLPTTFIINPKGELYKTLVGPQTFDSLKTLMNLPEINYDLGPAASS